MNFFLFGKNDKLVRFLSRTALLLALTIVMQYLTGFLGIQLLTGSIVNFFLILSTFYVGFLGGSIIGLFTPLIGFSIGIVGNIVLVPFVAISNFIYVAIYSALVYLLKVDNLSSIKRAKDTILSIVSIIVAASMKFLFMYYICLKLLLPIVLPKVPPQIAVAFGVTQLFTALIGGCASIVLFRTFKISNKG